MIKKYFKICDFLQNISFQAEEELEEQAELEKQLLDVGPAPVKDLPEVPAAEPAKPAKKKQEEEDPDMAELAAWAS